MSVLSINTHYNFSVHANSVLGTNYKDALLLSILDYSTALKFENIVHLHKQVFPYLPTGTISDQTKYSYYLFKVGDRTVVLADVWLNDATIEISNGTSYTVKLNNISINQLNMIRDQIRLLGINFSITWLRSFEPLGDQLSCKFVNLILT